MPTRSTSEQTTSSYSVKSYKSPTAVLGRQSNAYRRHRKPPSAYLRHLRLREQIVYGGPRLTKVKHQEEENLHNEMKRQLTDDDIRLPPLQTKKHQDRKLKHEILQSKAEDVVSRVEKKETPRQRDEIEVDPAPAFRSMNYNQINRVVSRVATALPRQEAYRAESRQRRMASRERNSSRERVNSAANNALNHTEPNTSRSDTPSSSTSNFRDSTLLDRLTKGTIASNTRAYLTVRFRPDPYNQWSHSVWDRKYPW